MERRTGDETGQQREDGGSLNPLLAKLIVATGASVESISNPDYL